MTTATRTTLDTTALVERAALLEGVAADLTARWEKTLAQAARDLRDSREASASRDKRHLSVGPTSPQAVRLTGGREAHRHGHGDADAALNAATYVRNIPDNERYTDTRTGRRRKTLADHRDDYLDRLRRERDHGGAFTDDEARMLAELDLAGDLALRAGADRRIIDVLAAGEDDFRYGPEDRELAGRQLATALTDGQDLIARLEDAGILADDTCDDPNVVRAIGYIRVSTREQGDSGHGLAAQEDAIRAACERRGWALAGIERDVISSRRKSRAGLERAFVQAYEASGVVVAAKADRLARSPLELLTFHDRAGREGWHLFCLDMEQVDTTTPLGKMMFTVMAAFAEFERAMISQRTREGLAAAKASGVKIGRPKAGEQSKRPKERQRAERALPRLRELRADGLSYRAIADALNDEGVEGLHGGRWWDRTARLALIRYGESDSSP